MLSRDSLLSDVVTNELVTEHFSFLSCASRRRLQTEAIVVRGGKKCKLSPVRSIGDNDFLRVISWACWYYHPLLVLVNYLLCYVAIYIC